MISFRKKNLNPKTKFTFKRRKPKRDKFIRKRLKRQNQRKVPWKKMT